VRASTCLKFSGHDDQPNQCLSEDVDLVVLCQTGTGTGHGASIAAPDRIAGNGGGSGGRGRGSGARRSRGSGSRATVRAAAGAGARRTVQAHPRMLPSLRARRAVQSGRGGHACGRQGIRVSRVWGDVQQAAPPGRAHALAHRGGDESLNVVPTTKAIRTHIMHHDPKAG
jgi:hypothetical protein